MKRSEIKPGVSYAVRLAAGTNADPNDNDLIRVRIDEVGVTFRPEHARNDVVGYRGTIIGTQKIRSRYGHDRWAAWEDDETVLIESGRDVIAPWDAYEPARADRLAEKARRQELAVDRGNRLDEIVRQLEGRGFVRTITWDDDEYTNDNGRALYDGADFKRSRMGARDHEPTITLTVDAIERLLS